MGEDGRAVVSDQRSAADPGRRHDPESGEAARSATGVVRRESFLRPRGGGAAHALSAVGFSRDRARGFALGRGSRNRAEDFTGPADPEKEKSVRWQEELLFYRNSEIRRRASLVNYRLQPDLVLCLHFNAEPWGDPASPSLVNKNHLHLLVNGAYLPAEIDLDDERCEMLHKLLSQAYPEELDSRRNRACTMAKKTGLAAVSNTRPTTSRRVGKSGYVYARNLMATRLYRCPTVYLEPYVMNSREVFARVEAGDYEGTNASPGKSGRAFFASTSMAWSKDWSRISSRRDRSSQLGDRSLRSSSVTSSAHARLADGVRDDETNAALLELFVALQGLRKFSRAGNLPAAADRQLARRASAATIRCVIA